MHPAQARLLALGHISGARTSHTLNYVLTEACGRGLLAPAGPSWDLSRVLRSGWPCGLFSCRAGHEPDLTGGREQVREDTSELTCQLLAARRCTADAVPLLSLS